MTGILTGLKFKKKNICNLKTCTYIHACNLHSTSATEVIHDEHHNLLFSSDDGLYLLICYVSCYINVVL